MPNILPPYSFGASYEWANITVNIMNVPMVLITHVMYNENQDSQNLYGAGNRPVMYALGNIEATAAITLYMDQVELLQNSVASGNLLDIPPFDITVSYLNGIKSVTHVIKNCRFQSNGRDVNQGDKGIPVELTLLCSHVDFKG